MRCTRLSEVGVEAEDEMGWVRECERAPLNTACARDAGGEDENSGEGGGKVNREALCDARLAGRRTCDG
jgi:hypothetical protein